MENKRRFYSLISILTALTLVFSMFSLIVINNGYSLWFFGSGGSESSDDLGVSVDYLGYNAEDNLSAHIQNAQIYDIYFLAQHINIEDFLRASNTVGDGWEWKASASSDSHNLYYTNPEEGISQYYPQLGTWNESFSTDSTIPTNLFKKFTDKQYLSQEEISSIGQPYIRIKNNASGLWPLGFTCWTLDHISIDYPTFYFRDTKHAINTGIAPKYPAKSGLSIYHRPSSTPNLASDGHVNVYGTFPNQKVNNGNGFDVMHLETLLEDFDNKAYNIKQPDNTYKKTLFVYPVYTLGKDYYYNNQVNDGTNSWATPEESDDCVRIRSYYNDGAGWSLSKYQDNYAAFDCEMTDLVHSSGLTDKVVRYGEVKGIGDAELWVRDSLEYKVYRIQNRTVTSEMVEKNLNSSTLASTNPYSVASDANNYHELTELERSQIRYGDYLFLDPIATRRASHGTIVGYLEESAGNLLNINYKEGLYNIYIFVKEFYCQPPISNNENPYYSGYAQNPNYGPYVNRNYSSFLSEDFVNDHIKFTENEINTINSMLESRNVNVDRTVVPLPYLIYLTNYTGGFGDNSNNWAVNLDREGRGYYVVFERVLTPENNSSYGDDSTHNFDLSRASHESSYHTSPGIINYDVDSSYTNISTDDAIVDLSNNPITLTYPSYYFTHSLKGLDYIPKQNISFGSNSPNYQTPLFNFFLANNDVITKEYVGDQYLEFMVDSIDRLEEEKNRISVTLTNLTTYTLAELETVDVALYNSIISQLEDVYLMRVKTSGSYRLNVVYYFNDITNEYEIDVWAASPTGYIVTVIDAVNGESISLDEDSLLTTRSWMIENYTLLLNFSFRDEDNILFGSVEDGNYTRMKVHKDKYSIIPPSAISGGYIYEYKGEKYIDIRTFFSYIDANDWCLYDTVTQRYLTNTNVYTNPFIIHGDTILELRNKPEGII